MGALADGGKRSDEMDMCHATMEFLDASKGDEDGDLVSQGETTEQSDESGESDEEIVASEAIEGTGVGCTGGEVSREGGVD